MPEVDTYKKSEAIKHIRKLISKFCTTSVITIIEDIECSEVTGKKEEVFKVEVKSCKGGYLAVSISSMDEMAASIEVGTGFICVHHSTLEELEETVLKAFIVSENVSEKNMMYSQIVRFEAAF